MYIYIRKLYSRDNGYSLGAGPYDFVWNFFWQVGNVGGEDMLMRPQTLTSGGGGHYQNMKPSEEVEEKKKI